MVNRRLARLFWPGLDELDHRLIQARFWLREVLCSPESGLMPDE